jgi:DNA-binding HxlR family transcriptional regulator
MDKIDTIGCFCITDEMVAMAQRTRAAKNGKRGMVMASSKSTMSCGCPVMAFQKLISGKYKIRILWDLKDGPLRYGEIRRGLLRGGDASEEITPRVLSRELKALAASGLIARKDFAVVPPKVEYRLTRRGQSFIPVIDMIRKWGMRHLRAADEPTPFGIAAE